MPRRKKGAKIEFVASCQGPAKHARGYSPVGAEVSSFGPELKREIPSGLPSKNITEISQHLSYSVVRRKMGARNFTSRCLSATVLKISSS